MSNFVLKGGRLIDGLGSIIEDSVVQVRDEHIIAVGTASELEIPADAEVIDVKGKVVMPGLIDAHVHIIGGKAANPVMVSLTPPEVLVGRALNDMKKLIDAGFTSVRDCGSHVAVHVRSLIAEGEYDGPQLKTSYKMLSQTGGHGDLHMLPQSFNSYGRLCDGVAECRKAAREMFREGADFIKICSSGGVLSEKDDPRSPQFTVEEIEAIVYEAQAFGSYVASHAQSTIGIKNALKAGVKTIEHGILLDDEAIELMLKQDAILVPTLAITHLIVTEGQHYGIPPFGLKKAQAYHDIHKENIVKAYKAGVKIAAGSDLMGCKPVEHGKNGLELALMVDEIGMSPMEAIMAATRFSAEAMAMEDVGVLAPGKKADLLVVDGDPSKDIHVLLDSSHIEKVFVDGKSLK